MFENGVKEVWRQVRKHVSWVRAPQSCLCGCPQASDASLALAVSPGPQGTQEGYEVQGQGAAGGTTSQQFISLAMNALTAELSAGQQLRALEGGLARGAAAAVHADSWC